MDDIDRQLPRARHRIFGDVYIVGGVSTGKVSEELTDPWNELLGRNSRDTTSGASKTVRSHNTPSRAKLTAGEVTAIRAAATGQRGECTALARRYGVGRQTIANILTGKTWQRR